MNNNCSRVCECVCSVMQNQLVKKCRMYVVQLADWIAVLGTRENNVSYDKIIWVKMLES